MGIMPALMTPEGNTPRRASASPQPGRFGGIEAGGTSFVCATGTGPDDIETVEFPTTTPLETVGRAVAWLREHAPGGLRAVGIASFGPVDLVPSSPQWGFITNTPKEHWRGYNFAGTVRDALAVPVAFDTDVNAALLGEQRWGAAAGKTACIYLTVGTGIGGAASALPLHGAAHPEMGHIRVPRSLGDTFPGVCPFHGDCLEGLASGPAIAARWGDRPENLPADHPAWRLEAEYLAQAAANYTCVLAPARILLGGGVMRQEILFPLIRARLTELLAEYVAVPEILAPALGPRAGVLGALALAASCTQSPRMTGVPL
jgi:fructokinase